MVADTLVRPLFLPRGAVLRIDRGRGVTVRARSGNLWITEAAEREDVVLAPGESATLARWGRAVVTACRPSHLVLELPAAAPLCAVELAPAEGGPGRPVRTGWFRVERLVRAIRVAWRRVFAPATALPEGRHAIARRVRAVRRALGHVGAGDTPADAPLPGPSSDRSRRRR